MSAENTPPKQRVVGIPWKPGQSGNPAGKPKGSRHKLGEDFLRDTHEAWGKHGAKALEYIAVNEPAKFVQVAASILPKEININDTSTKNESELLARIAELDAIIGNAARASLAQDRVGSPESKAKLN